MTDYSFSIEVLSMLNDSIINRLFKNKENAIEILSKLSKEIKIINQIKKMRDIKEQLNSSKNIWKMVGILDTEIHNLEKILEFYIKYTE